MKNYLLAAIIAAAASNAGAQTIARLGDPGSELIVTQWEAVRDPAISVLLVPGWGGGPSDVLGMADFLSNHGIEVFVLTPRGWHESDGTATFSGALEDIGAAIQWVRGESGTDVVLGGHSFGGGMSLAYAAGDPSVGRVFSVGGTDHAQFIRQYAIDSGFSSMVDRALASTAAPEGPIRFDVEAVLSELAEGQATYGLLENAPALSSRSLLLVGGWEDRNTTIDATLLPFYRELRSAGATDVTFLAYHADHSFASVSEELHADILDWLLR